MEPEETYIVTQGLCKHVRAATNTQATIEELLETMFTIESAPRLYNEDPEPSDYPCGGGFECLHRDPASRRRRRKGKPQI
jgi:hypothetical protein